MHTPKHEGNGSLETSEHVQAPETEDIVPASEDRSDMVATVATVAVVGITAAAFEAALLPGIVLCVAAVAAPNGSMEVSATPAIHRRMAISHVSNERINILHDFCRG